VPINSKNLLKQKLSSLASMSKEEILRFFKQDLTSLAPKEIVGHLEMAFMLMDPEETDQIKQEILTKMAPENKEIDRLNNYLQSTTLDQVLSQIPIKKEKPEVAALNPQEPEDQQKKDTISYHPKDYVQAKFPKSDHFDFDDAKDIEHFRQKGTSYQSHSFNHELDLVWGIVPEIIKSELNQDSFLKKRLENILITYLKDIRDKLETKQRLLAPRKQGGLGFDHNLVEEIFNILAGSKQGLKAYKTVQSHILELSKSSNKDSKFTKDSLKAKQEKAGGQQKKEPEKKKEKIIIKQNISSLDQTRINKAKKKEKIASFKKPKPPQPPEFISNFKQKKSDNFTARPAPGAKPANKITDIRHPKQFQNSPFPSRQTVSPTDEFATLTIEDLKRFATPADFVKKILEKIKILSKNDYAKKIKSIKAWKKSPLYRQYINIGESALKAGQGIKAYLTEEKNSKLNYNQFQAISELNEQLRF